MYPAQSECLSNTGDDQAKGRGPNEAFSAPVVYINGLPWRIGIRQFNAYIDIYLKHGLDLSQFGVVSCNKSGECLMKQGHLDNFDVYTANDCNWGLKFVKIEELMDPKNGLYDEKEDAVTFKAEVRVRIEDVLLVNGEAVNVNKHKKILKEMSKEDFAVSGKNYFNYLSESNKLGDEEIEELRERHKKLFGM
uniref:MATH domain-containing protein n=1 Tax=Globodera pallida TaxID=36090 RepID=A0A183C572_GLOPA